MAIWMDDIETKPSSRWRQSDLALVASLAVVVTLQFAVAVYVFDFSSTANAAVSIDTNSTVSMSMPETWATRFSAKPATSEFDGQGASAGPALWFNQGSAEAHVSFTSAGQPMFAPKTYAFAAGGMRVSLGQVPTDYRDTTNIPSTSVMSAPSAVASFVPDRTETQAQTKSTGKSQNIAALRSYLGESGFAAMGTRCGNLLDKAYRYDGGLIALCRQVRATL